MEYNIDELVSSLDFKSNSLNNIGNGIFLSNYEISILDKYNIEYRKCLSLKEILFYIEDILNNEDYDIDLDNISKSIAERDYYQNSNK